MCSTIRAGCGEWWMTPNEYTRSNAAAAGWTAAPPRCRHGSCTRSPRLVARSSRCRASAADSSDSSTAVTCAPARAKLHGVGADAAADLQDAPPLHRRNSANTGMCGSTKYFRCSTSSKYSLVPTASASGGCCTAARSRTRAPDRLKRRRTCAQQPYRSPVLAGGRRGSSAEITNSLNDSLAKPQSRRLNNRGRPSHFI